MIKMYILPFVALQLFASTGQEKRMRANIAATSPEGLAVIEEAKGKAPEIHSSRSAKRLGDAVDDCSNSKGQNHIDPIGWSAVKNPEGRWTISFYFKDARRKYLEATWEYNQETGVLFPAEFANATKFWVRRSDNKRP